MNKRQSNIFDKQTDKQTENWETKTNKNAMNFLTKNKIKF